MLMRINKINILNFLLILSFFIGFYLKENSAGGGEGDYGHILNNYQLIFNNYFEDINWENYRDSRFPLDYFIYKLYLPNHTYIWQINVFLLSLVVPFFLFFVLKLNNKLNHDAKLNNNYLLFLSLFLFISPYFRTSSFWMLRENTGYLFWIISVYFLLSVKSETAYRLKIFFCFIFSYLSFYSSQNLFIVPLTNFFILFDFKKFFSKKNLFLITINVLFFSPLIIFLDFFQNSIQYIEIEEINRITFSIYKIVDFYSIILIYIFPIFLIYFSFSEIFEIFKKNFMIIIFFILFYVLFFWGYSNEDPLSGGAIRKILNILISNNFIFKIFYLSISGFSFLVIFYFTLKKEKFLFYLILPYTIFYTFINYVFQEYLDPLFFIFILSYSKNFLILAKNKVLYLFTYFFLFYLTSLYYYNVLI